MTASVRHQAAVAEVHAAEETVVWSPSSPVPLLLSGAASAVWRHRGLGSAADVTRQLAEETGTEATAIAEEVAWTLSMLVEGGLLDPPEVAAAASSPVDHQPTARPDPVLRTFLDRAAPRRVPLALGRVRLGIGFDDPDAEAHLRAKARTWLGEGSPPLAYAVVHDEHGWLLLDDLALPLAVGAEEGPVLDALETILAQLLALQAPGPTAFRFASIVGPEGAWLVENEFLTARPAFEPTLEAAGWCIRPTPFVRVDQVGAMLLEGRDEAVPVLGILHGHGDRHLPRPRTAAGWTGFLTLEPPDTDGAWVWLIALRAAIGAHGRHLDRHAVLDAAANVGGLSRARHLPVGRAVRRARGRAGVTPTDDGPRFAVAPGVSWMPLFDGVVVVNATSGEFVELDRAAAAVWRASTAETTMPSLAAEQLEATLTELVRRGLLVEK